MTNVFNIFVMLQIFNMLNARKVNDEKNIFEGFFTNPLFIAVWIVIIGGQIIIVELTGVVFEVSKGGVTWYHWIIAVILGLICLVWDFILKLIPDTVCPQFGKKQKNPLENENENILSLRKKRT